MLEDAIIEGALSWGQDGDIRPSGPDAYTWPVLEQTLAAHPWRDKRAIDLGSGNGVNVNRLASMGFQACGVELSHSGTEAANRMFPDLDIRQGSIYDDLAGQFGMFPLVICPEVIEHCTAPRRVARSIYNLLEPGGLGILSTPYHGWLKNIVISASGRWDEHHHSMIDGGHVKFLTIKSLRAILAGAGFTSIDFRCVGRIPALAKAMIAIVRK